MYLLTAKKLQNKAKVCGQVYRQTDSLEDLNINNYALNQTDQEDVNTHILHDIMVDTKVAACKQQHQGYHNTWTSL